MSDKTDDVASRVAGDYAVPCIVAIPGYVRRLSSVPCSLNWAKPLLLSSFYFNCCYALGS